MSTETTRDPNDIKWEAPVVYPGDTVYRCADGTRRAPYPAIVIKSSGRTISLQEIGGGLFEGVRNIDDPMLNDAQIQDFGCWALSHTGERMLALEEKIERLSAQLDALMSDGRIRRTPADNIQGRKT
jgi:hypothetical protein